MSQPFGDAADAPMNRRVFPSRHRQVLHQARRHMTPHQQSHHSIEQVGIEDATQKVLSQEWQVVAKAEQRVGGHHSGRHHGREKSEAITNTRDIPVDKARAFEPRVREPLSRQLRRDETLAAIDVHQERSDVFAVGYRE